MAPPDASETGMLLGIAGSPRRGGNSERLLDSCLDGARDSGMSVFKLRVADYHVEACRGCNSCSIAGECVVHDRMHEVYELLDSATAVVVATPVFFASVPAVLKALYDRCQPYWARYYELGQPRPPKRPGGLLIARGGGDPFGHECAVTPTRSVFNILGLVMEEPVVVVGVDSPGDMGAHPEALERARALGVTLAEGAEERQREHPAGG